MSSIFSIQLTPENFGTLAICAIRYCQGRQTYMPATVRGICRHHLRELSDNDLGVMINDCEFQKDMNLYGHETIDKPGWIEWEKLLWEEKKRRSEAEKRQEKKQEQPVPEKKDKIKDFAAELAAMDE